MSVLSVGLVSYKLLFSRILTENCQLSIAQYGNIGVVAVSYLSRPRLLWPKERNDTKNSPNRTSVFNWINK